MTRLQVKIKLGPNGLGNLARYETSKWNMYLKAAKRLDELQAKRLEQAG